MASREAHDAARRTIVGFHFYMLQADAIPIEQQHEHEGREYGQVRKRLIRRFDCSRRTAARMRQYCFRAAQARAKA